MDGSKTCLAGMARVIVMTEKIEKNKNNLIDICHWNGLGFQSKIVKAVNAGDFKVTLPYKEYWISYKVVLVGLTGLALIEAGDILQIAFK